jgi:biopolymer transport protein ExbD
MLEIHDGGQFFAEGQLVTTERITELVRSRDPAKLAVTIAGSEDASLQQVMRVIDAVRIGGATQIGLAARQAAR